MGNVTSYLIEAIVAVINGMFGGDDEDRHYAPSNGWVATALISDLVVWVLRFFLGLALLVGLGLILLAWVLLRTAYEVVTSGRHK